jgi:hypothetical protein
MTEPSKNFTNLLISSSNRRIRQDIRYIDTGIPDTIAQPPNMQLLVIRKLLWIQ